MKPKTTIIGISSILSVTFLFIFWYSRDHQKDLNHQNNSVTVLQEEYSRTKSCEFSIYQPKENSLFKPKSDIRKEVVCSFLIHVNLPEYRFKITGKRGQNDIESIEISRGSETDSVQTFTGISTYPATKRIFETQDINFDGYFDVRTAAWYGSAGYTGFHYWIFNPEVQQFELNQDLLNLANPKPDPKAQTIDAEEGTYKWENVELVKVG
jgi:hypothetical protein